MAFRKYVKDFGSYTTMHGLRRIIDAKATPKRIAWILVFTTAWIFFTVQISFVLQSYFEYPKKLKTEIMPVGFPFPAITLCNLGSFDFYTVKRLSEAKKNYDEQKDFVSNDTFIRGMYKFYQILDLMNENPSLNDTDLQVDYDRMFSRTTLAANIPTKMLSENGYREKEFIVKCTYRNKPCKFKKIFDPYFFNCYTFTAPNVTSSADDETTPLFEGIENGFTVMLLAGTRVLKEVKNSDVEGMPGIYSKDSALSGAGGVRVVIHPPGTKPFPLTEGYDIPPGQMASLSLTPKRRIRLDQPYGHCNEKYPFLNHEKQKLAGPYRRTACEKVCIQNYIFRECKCYENTLPTDIDLLPYDDDVVLSLNDSLRMNITSKTESMTLHDYCLTENYLEGEGNGSKEDPCKTYEKCSGTTEFHKCFKLYSSKRSTCDYKMLLNLSKKIKCADKVKARVMANATLLAKCRCHPSCNDVLYDVSYSLSQWPSQGFEGDTVYHEIWTELNYTGKFSSKGKKEFYQNYTDVDIKRALKDFSKINVYVADANVFLTTEEPAMTRTQLISDIGGQLGVWIGVSVLTISEVLELLFLMLMECFGKKSKEDKLEEVDMHSTSSATDEANNIKK